MKTCFIVCPIGNEGSDVRKRSDTLFKHVIAPVCQECSFEPIRIDKENTNGSLTDEIISHIQFDDLVIADITDLNPNAFYEIGYRAALKRPAIHLMSKNTNIPFDISSIRTFMYDLSDLDSVEEVKFRLVQTIQSINYSAKKPSINTEISSVDNSNAQILQELYKVQDSINKLTTSIEANNSTALSVLADKLANANTKTPETVMIESLIPLLTNHPDKLQMLIELSKQIPST